MEKDEEWNVPRRLAGMALSLAESMERFHRAMAFRQLVFVDDTRFVIRGSSAFASEADRAEAMEYAEISRVATGREQHASVVALTVTMKEVEASIFGRLPASEYGLKQVVLAGSLGEARGRAIGAMTVAYERLLEEFDAATGMPDFLPSLRDPLDEREVSEELARVFGGPAPFYLRLLLDGARVGRALGEADMRARGSRGA